MTTLFTRGEHWTKDPEIILENEGRAIMREWLTSPVKMEDWLADREVDIGVPLSRLMPAAEKAMLGDTEARARVLAAAYDIFSCFYRYADKKADTWVDDHASDILADAGVTRDA